MSRLFSIIVCCGVILSGCVIRTPVQKGDTNKQKLPFQQIDFYGLTQRYMKKEKQNPIEGIYSVSGSVSKRGKGFLGGEEREKTTDRKENYAKVAIIRDTNARDYLEVSMEEEEKSSYSIIGEFSETTGSSILIYKHLDAKGRSTTFTFTRDEKADVLEGVRVENEGNSTITYKLTYIKLEPK